MLYCARLGFVNFGGPQSGPDFENREEAHIASIWATSDLRKMGRYDGPPNSQNLSGRSIYCQVEFMGEKSEGILLHAIPYLGRQKILKVFSPNEGLISFMAKSANPAFTDPFCICEWVFQRGKKEIHSLKDISLIDNLLEIRKSYDSLCAAGKMAQDILRTQLAGKRTDALYALLKAYLKKLPSMENKTALAESFRIKLLIHEGLLSLEKTCASCGASALHLHEGESFCSSHAHPLGLSFSQEEWGTICALGYERTFSAFEARRALPIEKLDRLFKERLS